MNKIELNFYIESYNQNANNGEPFGYFYNYFESFDSKLTLREVLDIIFEKFVIRTGLHDIYITEELPKWLWQKYFGKDIVPYIFLDSIYSATLEDLEKQFSISDMTIRMMINPGIGATICNTEGVKLFFHTGEKDIHNRPHIHCSYSGQEYRIALDNFEILDKSFKEKQKNKLVMRIIENNQAELLKYWNTVVINGESVKLKLEVY